jgi:nitroimidazol reductase NimA-like FMN-containing flavoprotein (pyridoxamine 5'-phosphate oxidase superfamily)
MTASTGTTSIRRAKAAGPSLAKQVQKEMVRRSFCTLATAGADGAPHAVGVNYEFVGGHLYFATGESSKKMHNIRQNPRVAVFIPVRKYPMGPPFSIQFQGTATILSRDEPEIVGLLKAGKLKKITRFGVLEKEPDACFLKVKPAEKVHTYGLGIPLLTLIRNTAQGDRTVDFN